MRIAARLAHTFVALRLSGHTIIAALAQAWRHCRRKH